MIYPFNAATLPALSEVGGKGLSLMRMTHAQLPVPPGFVLSLAFFAPWMSRLQAISTDLGYQRNAAYRSFRSCKSQ